MSARVIPFPARHVAACALERPGPPPAAPAPRRAPRAKPRRLGAILIVGVLLNVAACQAGAYFADPAFSPSARR